MLQPMILRTEKTSKIDVMGPPYPEPKNENYGNFMSAMTCSWAKIIQPWLYSACEWNSWGLEYTFVEWLRTTCWKHNSDTTLWAICSFLTPLSMSQIMKTFMKWKEHNIVSTKTFLRFFAASSSPRGLLYAHYSFFLACSHWHQKVLQTYRSFKSLIKIYLSCCYYILQETNSLQYKAYIWCHIM